MLLHRVIPAWRGPLTTLASTLGLVLLAVVPTTAAGGTSAWASRSGDARHVVTNQEKNIVQGPRRTLCQPLNSPWETCQS